MNWDAVGAIGEILGATAVIVTLAYLAKQVRQTKEAQQSSGLDHRTQAILPLSLSISTTPALAAAFDNAIKVMDAKHPLFVRELVDRGLSNTEALQLFRWHLAELHLNISQFVTIRDAEQLGVLDVAFVAAHSSGLGGLFWDCWWKEKDHDSGMVGRFFNHVEALRKERSQPTADQ